jgi:hypothetical protein
MLLRDQLVRLRLQEVRIQLEPEWPQLYAVRVLRQVKRLAWKVWRVERNCWPVRTMKEFRR